MRIDKITPTVLQSGSSGNCLILNSIIALDIGVTYKTIAPNVRKLKLVFCGHEHSDHFKKSTVAKLAIDRPTLRFCCGEWMVKRFVEVGVSPRNIDILDIGSVLDYGNFAIEPIELYHDVKNFGLKIFMGGEKAIYCVDTGSMDGIEAKGFDYYLIEGNHFESEISARIAEKQSRGEFSYEMRAAKYHLSYEKAMAWIAENAGPKSQYILLHKHREKEEP